MGASLLSRIAGRLGYVQKSGGDNLISNWIRGRSMANNQSNRLIHPYNQSAWVQRGIKTVVEPIAAADLIFTTDGRGGKAKFTDPKVNAFWQRPARDMEGPMTYANMIRATASWIKLAGESFWILGDEWMTTYAPRQPFLIARPDRMQEVLDESTGAIKAWAYTDAKGRRIGLKTAQVVHLKDFNPYTDYRGSSEYEAARVAAESDYASGVFSRNLAVKNGNRGRYVVAKGAQPLDDTQIKQIEAELRERDRETDSGNFGTAFLTGDVSVEDPKILNADAAFLDQRKQSRYEIYIALGVPPSFCDLSPSDSIRAAADAYKLIEQTCQPMGGMLADFIEQMTMRLGPIAPKSQIYADLSFAKNSAVREARKENIASWKTLTDGGVPGRDAGQYLAMDLPEYEGDQVGHLPFNVSPVKEINAPTAPAGNDPALAEGAQEIDPATGEPKQAKARVIDPFLEMTRALEDRAPRVQMVKALEGRKALTIAPPPSLDALDAARLMDAAAFSPTKREIVPNDLIGKDAAKDAAWAKHMKSRAPIMAQFRSKFRAELMKIRAEVLTNIESAAKHEAKAAPAGGIKQRKSAGDLIFDLIRFGTDLWIRLRPVEEQALDIAGQQINDEIGLPDPWKTPNADALAFTAQRENLIKGVSSTVFDQIKTVIHEGINEGKTYDQIADDVRAAFNSLADYEAKRIASTETAAAFGAGRDFSMRKSGGITHREWLTSRNSNVREWHREAEGQVRGINEAFEVGPDLLQYPGDPEGVPANVINCHCVVVAKKKPADAPDDQP